MNIKSELKSQAELALLKSQAKIPLEGEAFAWHKISAPSSDGGSKDALEGGGGGGATAVVKVRARYVSAELFKTFKAEACFFSRATAYARLEEMRYYSLSLKKVETAHRIFRDQCTLMCLMEPGRAMEDLYKRGGSPALRGGGMGFKDVETYRSGELFMQPLPSAEDARLAEILSRKEAYARFEELRLMAMSKQKMELARRVLKTQCHLMNLLAAGSKYAGDDMPPPSPSDKRALKSYKNYKSAAAQRNTGTRSEVPVPSAMWFEAKVKELGTLRAEAEKGKRDKKQAQTLPGGMMNTRGGEEHSSSPAVTPDPDKCAEDARLAKVQEGLQNYLDHFELHSNNRKREEAGLPAMKASRDSVAHLLALLRRWEE